VAEDGCQMNGRPSERKPLCESVTEVAVALVTLVNCGGLVAHVNKLIVVGECFRINLQEKMIMICFCVVFAAPIQTPTTRP